MNYGKVIDALEFAYENKKELAEACELGIHAWRRLETMTKHHNVTLDKVLTLADEWLHKLTEADSDNPARYKSQSKVLIRD